MHEEEVQRFPFWYIDFVKSPDGHMLQLNHEMCKAFQVHFHDCFAHCPDLLVQEFCSYLAARIWLMNVKSIMCWSRLASTNFQDLMVYLTKCTWSCCTYLYLFWWICSTIGLSREPSLVALPGVWSYSSRKVLGMFGRD